MTKSSQMQILYANTCTRIGTVAIRGKHYTHILEVGGSQPWWKGAGCVSMGPM